MTPIPAFNADSSVNGEGSIERYAWIRLAIEDHIEDMLLSVTSLASSNIFLSHDWLVKHNPEIDWKSGDVTFTRCPANCVILRDEKLILMN